MFASFLAAFFFALNATCASHSMRSLGPARANLGRLVVATTVLGVSGYQWALATTPSGIVLPLAATAPLLSIPIAFWLQGDRPTRRGIVGGTLAVAGCAALAAVR